ncbi:biotin--[acetyl-CoA-carboxylase] ligase [Canibacter zhoujuaniae]|uniref:biotin--[acetyl-CoA-carboxylase] ligase n=1 Tax=Canibacter zhoujuaniae TaxID=2708343 RepID=UPI00142475E3|nr:biotin--[acetyl-CoA-carboxylase] ligase [Canibacter zhoujuaniae]
MELLQTSQLIDTHFLPAVASTNDVAKEISATQAAPSPFLVVTTNQTAGRGRRDRVWQTPPGVALATSVYTPNWQAVATPVSWAPLLAGYAISQALAKWLQVFVKWPNDVLVSLPAEQTDELAERRGGAKLCGVLCETTGDGGIIFGAGVNVFTAPAQTAEGGVSIKTALEALGKNPLSATSFETPEGHALADELLQRYVAELLSGIELAGADPQTFQRRIAQNLASVKRRVRALLPGGKTLSGYAVGLGAAGELLVRDERGRTVAVASADVEHLRLD